MARPTSLTPQLQKEFCDAILRGHWASVACDLVGIDFQTYKNWLRRGEAGEAPYDEFFVAVKRAEGRVQDAALSFLHKAARKGQWQAAAWYLERRFPKKWPRPVTRTEGKLDVKGATASDALKLEDIEKNLGIVPPGEPGGDEDIKPPGPQDQADPGPL